MKGLRKEEAIVASLTAPEPSVDIPHPPRRIVVGALVLAAFAAAVVAFKLSLAGDHGPQVHAAIVAWITLSYTICGLVAWWRRPESRFGPLMVAAGFSPMLARLEQANMEILQTIGEALSLLPPVLFLHLFLAYPTGRLGGKAERALVAAGYATVLAFDLPRAVLEVTGRDVAQTAVQNVQRGTILALAVGALVVLVRRRWSSGRPLRRAGHAHERRGRRHRADGTGKRLRRPDEDRGAARVRLRAAVRLLPDAAVFPLSGDRRQGGASEPPLGRSRLRDPRPGLPTRLGQADPGLRVHGRDRPVSPDPALRDPLRALDGLPRLHPQPRA